MKLRDVLNLNYITLEKQMDIKDAMKKVVKESKDETLIDILYVVDTHKKLIGIVDLKELIIARSPLNVESIMHTNFHFILEDASIASAIDTIQDYDRNLLPIITKSGIMLGVLTADIALDLLAEESLEDFHKMASLNEYRLNDKPLERSKKRLPWLLILLALSLITASVLSLFQQTIETIIILVLFQPMILDSAGNISTQSLAKSILAINEDPELDTKQFMKKELMIGLINSAFVSIIGFLFSSLFLFVMRSETIWSVSITVGLTLLIALMVGATTGAIIPMILRRFKIDPSVASGPFMTTLNDVISLIIYFSLATIILIH